MHIVHCAGMLAFGIIWCGVDTIVDGRRGVMVLVLVFNIGS